MSSINLDRMNIFLSCHPQQSIIKIRNYSGLKLKRLSAQISGLGHRDDRTTLRGAQNHTPLPSRTDSFTERRLSLSLRDKTPRGMETQSARPSGCLPRTHPPNRHRQPLAATARRSGRGLALHSGPAGSLHKQRSRARGAHAEGQTQDHGRLPDSSGSTDLLCRSFLSLHSEEAATSVIDSTPSCLQWRRPTHLEFDPETNSPVVDEFGRCSDPTYYAAGNVVQASRNQAKVPIFYTAKNFPNPVDDAGQCWSQGRTTAKNIAKDLSGNLP